MAGAAGVRVVNLQVRGVREGREPEAGRRRRPGEGRKRKRRRAASRAGGTCAGGRHCPGPLRSPCEESGLGWAREGRSGETERDMDSEPGAGPARGPGR